MKKQGRVGERWVWDETDKMKLTGWWGAGGRFTRERTRVSLWQIHAVAWKTQHRTAIILQ